MLDLRQVSKFYHTRWGRSLILDKVDLTIDRSEHVGILGRNGSGKSTLIRLIGGSEYPSSGDIVRNMTVSWPLAFSGGFQSSLTGLDNLRFICRIYDTAYDDALPFVEEFTELGSHLREPVRTYSNGMRARLAFAMSMAIEFDCFLIDEVIAVGDARFQAKCHEELFERRRDRAMLMVSHDPHMIRDHCSRACVLENNTLREFPDVDSAFDFYNEFIMQPRWSIASQPLTSTQPVSQAGPAQKSEEAIQAAPSLVRSPTNSVPMADNNWKEQIITAFYRVLLGREPEPDGLRHHMEHMELLAQRDGKTAVEQTLKMFLASDEARNKSIVLFPDALDAFLKS